MKTSTVLLSMILLLGLSDRCVGEEPNLQDMGGWLAFHAITEYEDRVRSIEVYHAGSGVQIDRSSIDENSDLEVKYHTPGAGALVAEIETLTLYVCAGVYSVPNFVGMKVFEAKEAARSLPRAAGIVFEPGDPDDDETVQKQDTPAGTKVCKSEELIIVLTAESMTGTEVLLKLLEYLLPVVVFLLGYGFGYMMRGKVDGKPNAPTTDTTTGPQVKGG